MGVSKFLTLKVRGKAVGDDVLILIDGGGTRNYIDEQFVAKKYLPTEEFEGFKVANANGVINLCDTVVKKLGVRIEDHVVREDFYVYPMGGTPQMILRVQWLYSLGEIYSNYQKLEIKVKSKGKEITLKGIKENFRQISSHRLEWMDLWQGGREEEHVQLGLSLTDVQPPRVCRLPTP